MNKSTILKFIILLILPTFAWADSSPKSPFCKKKSTKKNGSVDIYFDSENTNCINPNLFVQQEAKATQGTLIESLDKNGKDGIYTEDKLLGALSVEVSSEVASNMADKIVFYLEYNSDPLDYANPDDQTGFNNNAYFNDGGQQALQIGLKVAVTKKCTDNFNCALFFQQYKIQGIDALDESTANAEQLNNGAQHYDRAVGMAIQSLSKSLTASFAVGAGDCPEGNSKCRGAPSYQNQKAVIYGNFSVNLVQYFFNDNANENFDVTPSFQYGIAEDLSNQIASVRGRYRKLYGQTFYSRYQRQATPLNEATYGSDPIDIKESGFELTLKDLDTWGCDHLDIGYSYSKRELNPEELRSDNGLAPAGFKSRERESYYSSCNDVFVKNLRVSGHIIRSLFKYKESVATWDYSPTSLVLGITYTY